VALALLSVYHFKKALEFNWALKTQGYEE